ncbi:hypothetical protein HYT59_00095 [Candidatus Woesebacteria bacterium]|nr:hypothetical protein [Candidatus Woesebacteria bacterium]
MPDDKAEVNQAEATTLKPTENRAFIVLNELFKDIESEEGQKKMYESLVNSRGQRRGGFRFKKWMEEFGIQPKIEITEIENEGELEEEIAKEEAAWRRRQETSTQKPPARIEPVVREEE